MNTTHAVNDDEFLAVECGQWVDFTAEVCAAHGVRPPTAVEWLRLRAAWAPGCAPIDSVDRLAALRAPRLVKRHA